VLDSKQRISNEFNFEHILLEIVTYRVELSPAKAAHHIVKDRTDLTANIGGANVTPELCNQIVVPRDFESTQQIKKNLTSASAIFVVSPQLGYGGGGGGLCAPNCVTHVSNLKSGHQPWHLPCLGPSLFAPFQLQT